MISVKVETQAAVDQGFSNALTYITGLSDPKIRFRTSSQEEIFFHLDLNQSICYISQVLMLHMALRRAVFL